MNLSLVARGGTAALLHGNCPLELLTLHRLCRVHLRQFQPANGIGCEATYPSDDLLSFTWRPARSP